MKGKECLSDSEQHSERETELPRKGEVKKKYSKVRTKLAVNTNTQRPKAPTSSFLVFYHDNKK
jgi:hypothetical protein